MTNRTAARPYGPIKYDSTGSRGSRTSNAQNLDVLALEAAAAGDLHTGTKHCHDVGSQLTDWTHRDCHEHICHRDREGQSSNLQTKHGGRLRTYC